MGSAVMGISACGTALAAVGASGICIWRVTFPRPGIYDPSSRLSLQDISPEGEHSLLGSISGQHDFRDMHPHSVHFIVHENWLLVTFVPSNPSRVASVV